MSDQSTKFDFGWDLQRSPDLQAGFNGGLLLSGGRVIRGREGEGKERKEKK